MQRFENCEGIGTNMNILIQYRWVSQTVNHDPMSSRLLEPFGHNWRLHWASAGLQKQVESHFQLTSRFMKVTSGCFQKPAEALWRLRRLSAGEGGGLPQNRQVTAGRSLRTPAVYHYISGSKTVSCGSPGSHRNQPGVPQNPCRYTSTLEHRPFVSWRIHYNAVVPNLF